MANTQRSFAPGTGGCSRGSLARDTRVPTPGGWRAAGDLFPGDLILDSAGRPAPVIAVTHADEGRPCLRVTFDDGEQIVAGDTQGWDVTLTHRKRRSTPIVATVTTAELADHLRTHNASVPLVATEGTDRYGLLVAPYFLGLWLGDGASGDSSICCDKTVLPQLMAHLTACLPSHEELVVYEKRVTPVMRPRQRTGVCMRGHDQAVVGRYTNGGSGTSTCAECSRNSTAQRKGNRPRTPRLLSTRERLRALGVANKKHIPLEYLTASRDQRWALLQGLMDSDGSIAENGDASFTNVNDRLADDFAALVVSLGFKMRRSYYADRRAHSIRFHPDGASIVRLDHKVARLRPLSQRHFATRRFVRSVNLVDSVPVCCVDVNTRDKLLLVGHHNTPTRSATSFIEATGE